MKNQIIKFFSMNTLLVLIATAGFSQPLALNTTSDSVSTERTSMEVNIPKAVKDAFAKQFPNAANPSWSVFPTNGTTNEWYSDSFMTDTNSRSDEGTWNKKDTSSMGADTRNKKDASSTEQGTWNDGNASSNREANSPYNKEGNSSTGQEENSTYGNTTPNLGGNSSDDQVGNSPSNREGYSSTSQEGNSSSKQGGASTYGKDSTSNQRTTSTYGKDSSSNQRTTSTYGKEGNTSSNQGSNSKMGGKSTTNQDGNSSTRVANSNSGTDNYYVAEFTSYKTEFKSVFKADGEKVATLNVSTKEVPAAISTALAKGTYKTWEMGDEITEIVKDQQSSDAMKVYKMEAKNDSETHALYFQADGKLLKDEIVD